MDVGFVGLGVMGAPMAGHLARAGHRLTLLDVDRARADAVAAELGAQVASSPAAVAAASEVVITMLPDGQVVHEVACGEQGLVQGWRAGALLLDCSSAEPWLTRQTAEALAAKGGAMVDAPVSGAAWGAAEAALVFMVGGAEADLQRVQPLLRCMGRQVHHLGPLGSGHAMKCLNNCVTAMTFAATTEALLAGRRAGLDPRAMVAVLNESTGGSWITRTHYEQRVFNRAFDDPFRLSLMLKDVGIALQLAAEAGAPMPMAQHGVGLWRQADQAAGPGASVSELVRWLEQQAGTELVPASSPPSA